MRRSCLFIPSSNPGMLQSADIYPFDAVIFDLEDAVTMSEKESARELLKNFLSIADLKQKEIMIRINSLDNDLAMLDLDDIVSDEIDTIMLPKARVSDIVYLDKVLRQIEEKKQMTKKINIVPIIELASSLLEVERIAAEKRVNGILLGAEDLTSDMEVSRTEEGTEIFYPRARIAMACKAFKIDAIDTPYTNVNNLEGLEKDSLVAKELGFNAKACIHPNQIDVINRIFSPTEKEILRAQKIVAAYEQEKKGAFSLDGKMIDKPIIERSLKIIAKAKKIGLL
ncbi:MAG TPA: CoA ester lyase [Bacilli bacterium]|mgnify:FL=1|jgi:citrate lyase subunit beta/citryl-CoA lyase|nr:CoA ester lyase [Bacilli bacterium]HOE06073.1 CoA ester lyase [Bacilli bacterium]HOR17268.1 CoA ester lyase [Bacilli bacterium]HPL55360.1 CoA ester lyase [Bacilli bacterium]